MTYLWGFSFVGLILEILTVPSIVIDGGRGWRVVVACIGGLLIVGSFVMIAHFSL